MANPNLAKNIGVKVGTPANIGEYVIITNMRTWTKMTQQLAVHTTDMSSPSKS